MVDCRTVYDKAVQENKDMTQMIKDTFFVQTLTFTAQQAAIDEWLAPHHMIAHSFVDYHVVPVTHQWQLAVL